MRQVNSIIKKYGLQASEDYDNEESQFLSLEMEAIRRGGTWKDSKGKEQGLGLAAHYKLACNLIWPGLDWHRWMELCNSEIRRPKAKITCLMGAGSTGKTNSSAWEYLIEYYCSPDDTLVLISSTDMRGLELRVWGEIKHLHEMAKERFEWLPGHLVDSKHCITTNLLRTSNTDTIRDLRKGVIGIPTVVGGKSVGLGKWCFPAGQMVDTPEGPMAIETIQTGQKVFTATGVSHVIATTNRISTSLVRITLADGRIMDCTPEHPVLTNMGFVNAGCISQSHVVYSADETLQALSETIRSRESTEDILQPEMQWPWNPKKTPLRRLPSPDGKVISEILLAEMPAENMGKAVQAMRDNLHSIREKSCVLHKALFCKMEDGPAGNRSENDTKQGLGCQWQGDQQKHSFKQEGNCAAQEVCTDIFHEESPQASRSLQHGYSDGHRANPAFCFPTSGPQLQSQNRNGRKVGLPSLISHRRLLSENKTGGGNRWPGTFQVYSKDERHQQGQIPFGTRVVGVAVLKSSSDARHSESEGGYRVYDLQVEGHPSFSVNGIIVHNCGIKQKHLRLIADDCAAMSHSFLSGFSNLNNNQDFQAIICFNPDDPLDPGGVSAEPVDGWSSHMEPTKTTVWDTRFFSGRCVNLVGLDSPNFDFPDEYDPPHFSYLISKKKIDETISGFGKDTFEYYSQCVGVMKISQLSRRIVTRDLCRQFHASDKAVWDGSGTEKVAALDAAYGGDRCVGGYIEYGRCMDGKRRIMFHPPHIVPVKVGGGEEPMAEEDFISRYEMDFCARHAIDPSNFFHDSTGRGSLGTSLARTWSSECNPVEFGGSPTKRPVTSDMFIIDKSTGERRLKRCDEHYRKFVSELWYSLRYAIEADQVRGLTQEVIDELCTRNWRRVADDKIEVESKNELKRRIRKSSDLGDWAALCIEGARRRGFVIARFSPDPEVFDEFSDYEAENKELDDILKSKMLHHE